MKEKLPKLPPMFNAYVFGGGLLFFVFGVIGAAIMAPEGLPDPVLILIGSVGTALTGGFSRTVKYYTNGESSG